MKHSATLLAAVAVLALLSCVAYAQNQTGTMPALGSTKGGGSGGSGTTTVITVTNNSPCEVKVTVNGDEREIQTNRSKTFNVNTNTFVKITVKPEHPRLCSITNWGGFSNTLSQSSASATISSDGSMTVS